MASTQTIFYPLVSPLDERRDRGGWRMRLDAAERTRSRSPQQFSAVLGFILEWAEGILSVPRLWAHANRLVEDNVYGDKGD